MEDAMKKNIQDLTPADITRAYSGRQGCMCGCKGKYYVSKAVEDDAPSIVNPGMVTKVLRTIQANEEAANMEADGSCVYLDLGGRSYVAYLG
jgi:hypothetical protein